MFMTFRVHKNPDNSQNSSHSAGRNTRERFNPADVHAFTWHVTRALKPASVHLIHDVVTAHTQNKAEERPSTAKSPISGTDNNGEVAGAPAEETLGSLLNREGPQHWTQPPVRVTKTQVFFAGYT